MPASKVFKGILTSVPYGIPLPALCAEHTRSSVMLPRWVPGELAHTGTLFHSLPG